MNDKFERLKNMVLNNIQSTDEPIDDTLSDIIGYALLWKMLRNHTFDLPLEVSLEEEKRRLEEKFIAEGGQPWKQRVKESRDSIIRAFKCQTIVGTNGRGRSLE